MNQGSKPEALKLTEEIITSILHDTDIEKEIMNKNSICLGIEANNWQAELCESRRLQNR